MTLIIGPLFLGSHINPIMSTVSSENLIINSDFETNLDGWSDYGGSFSLTTEEVHNGSLGVKLRAEDGEAGIRSNKITGLVDSEYYLSLWIYKDFYLESAHVSIEWYTDGGITHQGYKRIDIKSYLGWTQITWQGERYNDLTDTFELKIHSSDQEELVYHFYLDEVWFAANPNPDYSEPVKDNLVHNSDFETGVTGWFPREGTISRSSKDAHNGSYSMKMESEVTYDGYIRSEVTSALLTDLDDSTYYLSILVSKEQIIKDAYICITWFNFKDPDNGYPLHLGETVLEFDDYKGWTQITWQGSKYNSETDSCEISIRGMEPSDGSHFTFYVDEVWFSDKPYAHEYQDASRITIEATPFFSDNLMYFVFILVLAAWIKRKYQ